MPSPKIHLLTDDDNLFARLRELDPGEPVQRLRSFSSLAEQAEGSIILIDVDTLGLPAVNSQLWQAPSVQLKLGFLSTHPGDEEGIALLEAGACAYCHAYAAEATLRQMIEVIASGELWVGRSLMGRLLKNIKRAAQAQTSDWQAPLTEREHEVAQMAAMGNSNLQIAETLGITERTVKAHLTAIFEKLAVKDRLQLALKVHGIQ